MTMAMTEFNPARFWRQVIRSMGGTSTLMQDRIDELYADRDRLAKRVRWLRSMIRACRQRRNELQSDLVDLTVRYERLVKKPTGYRQALDYIASCAENCDFCRILARATLSRAPADSAPDPAPTPLSDERLRAYLLLDDVFTLIDERACSGDVREAMYKLWRLLEHPHEDDEI
jgi:hypothetical protein